MLDYKKIFGREPSRKEKLEADTIARMMAEKKIKAAVAYAEGRKIDAKTFGRIARYVP